MEMSQELDCVTRRRVARAVTAPTAFVISGATHSSASRGLVSTVGGKKKQNP